MSLNSTPGKLGFYFPAEWQRHQATWLSWPHNEETWPGDVEQVYPGYLHFIKELSKSETVCINVADQSMEQSVRQRITNKGVDQDRIKIFHHPTNDAWCRDHGPVFLVNDKREKIVVDWEYNAWGDKYPPFELDNAIPSQVAKALNLEIYQPGLVLEGGSVDFNGKGTVLTTTSCLLHPNRNPEMTKESLERSLMDVFGIGQVLWLQHGIAGDDTDGHIDTIARFVASDTIVAVVEDDPREENYGPLQENLRALKSMKLSNGQPLRVLSLPMPQPMYNQGQRLPATYANFYVCNTAVLVPTYNDPNDQKAFKILGEVFKDREIVGIDSMEIIKGLGGLHCLCMQEPV